MSTGSALKGRSLLSLKDLSREELVELLDLADVLKREKAKGRRGSRLQNKSLAMIFEKMSTRTRCAFIVAAADEGGVAECLPSGEMHLGKKETVADTARVLGRMFDGIVFRGYHQATVVALAKHSGVPVWNALTDEAHPTQALADLQTIREHFGDLDGLKVVYVGDGRNNVANSLMLGCAMAGLSFVNCTPSVLEPDPGLMEDAQAVAEASGGSVAVMNHPGEAVQGANVVYTDVWASMGEESKLHERIELLRPYQVNLELMKETGNLECGDVIFLHCLPAFHNSETAVARDVGAMEVTDDVFEAPFSKVFDQAENRVHTIKALLVAALGT